MNQFTFDGRSTKKDFMNARTYADLIEFIESNLDTFAQQKGLENDKDFQLIRGKIIDHVEHVQGGIEIFNGNDSGIEGRVIVRRLPEGYEYPFLIFQLNNTKTTHAAERHTVSFDLVEMLKSMQKSELEEESK